MPHLPAMPRFHILEEDEILATRDITPPQSGLPLSPPTSGLAGLVEDFDNPEGMYSHQSHLFSLDTSRASEEQDISDIDFNDFDPQLDPRRRRSDTEPLPSHSEAKQEQSDQDNDVENKRPSKYDTKPPPLETAQTAKMATLKKSSSSGSVRPSPRQRGSAGPGTKPTSSTSTPPQSPLKSHSRTTSRRQSVLSKTSATSTPEHDAAANHDNTEDDEDDDADDNDVVDDDDNAAFSEHKLRKRTLKQINPFKFDKHEHQAQKSGKRATAKKIERAVKAEIDSTQEPPPKKKARASTSRSTKHATKSSTSRKQSASMTPRESSPASETATATPPTNHTQGYDPARVTLRVRLDRFVGAATPTTLSKCNDIDTLMDFIKRSWEWAYGSGRFCYAIASFPWLSDKSNILLRAGFQDSFQEVVTQVEIAPCWAECQARCEVEVTVHLQ